jgi:hypothetical protein
MLPRIALIQGFYFLVTGIWPLLHIQSFLLVTGPKTDLWLVKTVGVLVGVIGAVLLGAARSRRITREIVLLAVGSALGLAMIDLVYARHFSPVYLADAAAELCLVLFWAIGRARGSSP